jgi:hypothetical protein
VGDLAAGPYRRLRTPRAAAVAGAAFALLFAVSLALLRSTLDADPRSEIDWAGPPGTRVRVAVALVPFAGIAFLWFLGVVRDRLGDLEDRFLSTVFVGSGLLFVAMTFVSVAILGGLVATAGGDRATDASREVAAFGRAVMLQISHVYALRMGSVLMLSLSTIWLRTGLMPRWLVAATYLVALTMLVVISLNLWVTLLFPAWVLTVSLYILLRPAN